LSINHKSEHLHNLGVFTWDIWEKEISNPWTYDSQETCYFLAGNAIVTPDGEQPVQIGQGDLVIFPAGMSCTWEITSDVKKHYFFD
jgi:uncharacterized cupin superfamily protein